VITESRGTALAFASEQSTDKALRVDIAVLVPDGSDDDASGTTQRLREMHIVPLLYGVGQSTRTRAAPGDSRP